MPTVRFGATVDADSYPLINLRDPLAAQEADTLAARNAAISAALADYATSAAVTAALVDKADLVGGKLPTSQLPALAITDTFTVASQAAMLALSCEVGDVAVRSDMSETYILAASPASVLGNWVKLATPTDLVVSVNGQQGVVVLSAADVGAAAASHTHALADVSGLVAALAGKADAVHSHVTGDVTGLDAALAGKAASTDPRLSDARTPVAHKTSHATGGSDALAPADIGAASSSALSTHVSDAANPHAVTAAQVGLGQLAGGTTGQVLAKVDGTDYNTQWVTAATGGGPGSGYEHQDYEKAASYVYVGYEHPSSGAWFIYRRTLASNVREQADGASSYATNWTGRAGLTYV